MKQMSKFVQGPIWICHDFFGCTNHLKHRLEFIPLLWSRFDLFFCDFRSGSRKSSEVECQVVLKMRQSIRRCDDLFHLKTAVRIEVDPIEAAVCRTDLVLRPHSFAD